MGRAKTFSFSQGGRAKIPSDIARQQKRSRYSSGPMGRQQTGLSHQKLLKAAVTIQTFFRNNKTQKHMRRAIHASKQADDQRKRLAAQEADRIIALRLQKEAEEQRIKQMNQ